MLPSVRLQKLFLLLSLIWLCLAPALTAFQVTGATGGINSTTGARPLRYEIHDFANSGAPFELFILSLIEFQAADQSELLSYFQISGLSCYPLDSEVSAHVRNRNSWLPSHSLGWSGWEWQLSRLLLSRRGSLPSVASTLYGIVRGNFPQVLNRENGTLRVRSKCFGHMHRTLQVHTQRTNATSTRPQP